MDEMEVEKEVAQNSKSDFQTQLEESLKEFNAPQAGQLVEGTVVQVTNDNVYVDVGDKSEGLIPVEEFAGDLPKEGDKVQALLMGHNSNGPILSKKKADSKRYLREIHDANYQVREFARRAAMNAPIQGTAADLIKIAMIRVNQALKEQKFESKIICQIHDELLLKVPSKEKDKVYDLVKNIMENAMKLDVKLEVDGGFGRTWYDCK